MFKFRNPDETNVNMKKTDLQINWQSYLNIAFCINGVIFQQLNTMFGHKIKAKPMILTALAIDLILVITLMVFTKINTDEWQWEFMIISLVIASWIGANEAILLGAFYGVIGKFPSAYIGAVAQGNVKFTLMSITSLG